MPTSSEMKILGNMADAHKLDFLRVIDSMDDKEIEDSIRKHNEKNELDEVKKKLHSLGLWTKDKEKVGLKIKDENAREKYEQRYKTTLAEKVIADALKSPALQQPPDNMPCALCFDIANSAFADHVDVLHSLRRLTSFYKRMRIETLQYLPLEQRWRIIMDSPESCRRLSNSSLNLNGVVVQLRRYDEVVHYEYKKQLRTSGLVAIVKKSMK